MSNKDKCMHCGHSRGRHNGLRDCCMVVTKHNPTTFCTCAEFVENPEWKWNDQKLIKSFLAKNNVGWTAGEIELKINRPGSHRRLSEMERMGLAKRGRSRKCSVTGKLRDTWFDDDSPPRPEPVKKPLVHENRLLKDRIKWLEDRCEKMQAQLELYAKPHD